jgi:Aminopeptidase N
MRNFLLAIWMITGFTQNSAIGQTKYPVNPNQDILHYSFNITINDSTDEISGEATILFKVKDANKLILDLTNKGEDDKGMVVEKVTDAGDNLSFEHENDRLIINIYAKPDTISEINIVYKGVPKSGLIIGDNKFGDRVFFGDNYPDRARNWLPCVDHPSDKATVEWIVSAPEHYKVVASGKLVSESQITNGYITTTYNTKVPISTKVMVFGAADFSVDQAGRMNSIPVTTWVYSKNEKEGFIDYAIAPKVLAYFDSLIAPYPYEKLANVQSRTTYGGMENAGNIFYYENSVTGKKSLSP